jgi:CTP-dependent riboflavin kinase
VRARGVTRTGTSHFYVDDLSRELGTQMFRGSLNVRLCETVVLPRPRQLSIAQEQWEAVPVILNECAVGVHAWKHAIHDPTYLEVFAPIKLVPVLGLENGDRVVVRILPGSQLHRVNADPWR